MVASSAAVPANLTKVMKVLNGTIERVALQVLGQNYASLELILSVTLVSLFIISGCVICVVIVSRSATAWSNVVTIKGIVSELFH